MPLSCRSLLRLMPWRSAMAESVSPSFTVTLPPVALARDGVPLPGIVRRLPASTRSASLILLALISSERLTPWRSAMAERVSPGRTTTSAARTCRGIATARARAARVRRMGRTQSCRHHKVPPLARPAPACEFSPENVPAAVAFIRGSSRRAARASPGGAGRAGRDRSRG